MPKNQFQRMTVAFLTVVVTVHAYVLWHGSHRCFYSAAVFLFQKATASFFLPKNAMRRKRAKAPQSNVTTVLL